MDNEQKAKDLANKHLKLQGVGLPIRFNRRVHKAFLNAISEALTIHSVSKSLPKKTAKDCNCASPKERLDCGHECFNI
jgi:zona occludens toxin (predicted ATPase)